MVGYMQNGSIGYGVFGECLVVTCINKSSSNIATYLHKRSIRK